MILILAFTKHSIKNSNELYYNLWFVSNRAIVKDLEHFS